MKFRELPEGEVGIKYKSTKDFTQIFLPEGYSANYLLESEFI